jgi:hypothetical protein
MDHTSQNLRRSGGIFTIGLLLVATSFPLTASAADKVILCHNGTTIEVSENAVYGRGGHLNFDDTPQGGHEGD